MRGAAVFLIVFLLSFALTLSYGSLPPGDSLADQLGVPETSYEVLGIPAKLFAKAVLNGVTYGVAVWFAYSLVRWLTTSRKA